MPLFSSRVVLLLFLQCSTLVAFTSASQTSPSSTRRVVVEEEEVVAQVEASKRKSIYNTHSTIRTIPNPHAHRNRKAASKSIVTFPLLHSHHVVNRRLLESRPEHESSSSSSTPSIPWGDVYQGFGTHYVDLWIGSPPQRQTVIIDTGSDITAFPCEECTNRCGQGYHVDESFDHSKSTSFEKVQCEDGSDEETCLVGGTCDTMGFVTGLNDADGDEKICRLGVRYAEGSSWDAFEAKDTVYLGGLHDEPLLDRTRRRQTRRRTTTHPHVNDTGPDRDYTAAATPATSSTARATAQYLRGLDGASASATTVKETAHNTADLEAEFLKEAHEEEQKYKDKHISSTINDAKDEDAEMKGTDVATEVDVVEEAELAKKFSFELSFGCQYRITGLFRTQLADGIMGMELSDDSFWMQMYNANAIQSKMFALCFTKGIGEPKPTGTLAGAMTMGGSDVRLHKSKMVYAESIDTEGWYTVYVKGIYLQMKQSGTNRGADDDNDDFSSGGNRTLIENDTIKLDLDIDKVNKEGVIIDSGTTDSYLPSFINKYFEDAFEELYGYTLYDTVHSFNPEEVVFEDLPTIIIQLQRATNIFDHDDDAYDENGEYESKLLAGELDTTSTDDVIIEIPPNHYLSYNEKRKKLQSRIHIDDEDGFGLLGANSMFNYDILFDMDNSRIGFAKSDCNHAEIEV